MEYYSCILNEGNTISINIKTDGAPITLMVMDSNDFNTYNTGFSKGDRSTVWNTYATDKNIVENSYTFTAPTTDRYYLVLDNSGWVKDSTPPTRNVNVNFKVTMT